MILRRIAEALKRQDWSQVTIEILIVVIGIFLGLQVQAWYEELADRRDEQVFLKRLHIEVVDVIDLSQEYILGRQKILDQLKSFSNILNDDGDITALTNDHCATLAVAHVYSNQLVQLPTINELISSGQLGLIKNESVRTALSEYTIGLQQSNALLANIQASQMDLSRKYPDVISLDGYMTDSGLDGQPVSCNFEMLEQKFGFKNDVVNSTSRFVFFVRYITSQYDRILNLHRAVDNELDILHD